MKGKLLTALLIIFILIVLSGYVLVYYQSTKSNSIPNNQTQQDATICNALTNITPKKGEKIKSPLTVTVTVDNTKSCHWTVFEAQAGTLLLKDGSGQTIGTGTLTTTEEWMTDQPVMYTGSITFTKPTANDLILTITEEDPSGKGGKTAAIPLTY